MLLEDKQNSGGFDGCQNLDDDPWRPWRVCGVCDTKLGHLYCHQWNKSFDVGFQNLTNCQPMLPWSRSPFKRLTCNQPKAWSNWQPYIFLMVLMVSVCLFVFSGSLKMLSGQYLQAGLVHWIWCCVISNQTQRHLSKLEGLQDPNRTSDMLRLLLDC